MSRSPALLSPTQQEQTQHAASSSFAAHVRDVIARVLDTLTAAMSEAEDLSQEAATHSARETLLTSLNVYRAASMSALAALQPLSLAAVSRTATFEAVRRGQTRGPVETEHIWCESEDAAREKRGGAELIARLKHQLRRQEEEAETVEALLKSRLESLEATVRTLRSQQNVDFEKLEHLVKDDVRRSKSSSPTPPPRPQHSQPQQLSYQSSHEASMVSITYSLARWCGRELIAMEARERAHLVSEEAADRQVFVHRRILARAVVRARRHPASATADGTLNACEQDTQTTAVVASPPATARSLWASTTQSQHALESDVHHLAEYAASLHQDLRAQHTQMRDAVGATRESMEAVHLHALEKLAARHTEERRVLEERLNELLAAVAETRAQHERQKTQAYENDKERRAAADAYEAQVEDLRRQLVSAKKRALSVELEKDKLQARVRVLTRQLEDTVPRRARSTHSPERGQRCAAGVVVASPNRSSRPSHPPNAGDHDDDDAHTYDYHSGGGGGKHIGNQNHPRNPFAGYREQETWDDDDAVQRRDAQPASAAGVTTTTASDLRVHPTVWLRQLRSWSSPPRAAEHTEPCACVALSENGSLPAASGVHSPSAIAVTAVRGPSSSPRSATAQAEERDLVLTPRASSASAIRRRRVREEATIDAQSLTHTRSDVHDGEETFLPPSPSMWASSSPFASSPAPKAPMSEQACASLQPDAPKAANQVRTHARLDGMRSTLLSAMDALRTDMQHHTTTREVQRRQHQREARHLNTTRHYYEHALGLPSHAGEDGYAAKRQAGANAATSSLSTPSDAMPSLEAAASQLTSICTQLKALQARGVTEEEVFGAKMAAARQQYKQLALALETVQEKQAALRA